MFQRIVRWGSPLFLSVCIAGGARSGEADQAKKPSADGATTHTVKPEPFKIEVKLAGVFEATEMAPIAAKPEEWTDLVVVKAVRQGKRVSKGEPLIRLDTRKIDAQIESLTTEGRISALAMRQAELELALLDDALPRDLEMVQRTLKNAREDLQHFLKVGRPLAEKQEQYTLKSAQFRLESAQEELDQLEKMYKADDLTEETEEIILKRARHSVELAKFALEKAVVARRQTLETGLPRQEAELKEKERQGVLAWEKAKAALPGAVETKRLELEKTKHARRQAEVKLAGLRSDRAGATIRSPLEGIVYYGACARGKWSGAAAAEQKLRPGGKLLPREVVMTVVRQRPMLVRATLPEKDLYAIRPGLAGKIVPTGFPDLKLPAKVEAVSHIPTADGNFEAMVSFDAERAAELMPGMTCTIKLVPYLKRDALTVPAKAVFTDPLDEEKKYVWVLGADAAPEKRRVAVGRKSGQKVEIVRGLKPGETVSLKEPKPTADQSK